MRIERYLLAFSCLCLWAGCDNDDDNLLCYGVHTDIEGDVTAFGAVGDGKTDCAEAINRAIASLPAEGGVLVIPEGDFVLDAPVVVNKDNVTIKGLNPGMRSNIDVNGINDLLGPGGGSKLVARNAQAAIKVEANTKGVKIMDLMVSGGTESKNIGIHFAGTNEDALLSNIIGINLHTGMKIEQAENLQIRNCWVCELPNSIELLGGSNITVRNCQLGAQPTGITCKMQGVEKLSFVNNQVYPDGRENLVLDRCNHCTVEGNNFKSYYTGILVLDGNENLVSKNIFWLTGALQNQLLDRGDDFGVIHVTGNGNRFVSNSLSCEWAYADAVTVNAVRGTGNVFENCFVDNVESSRVFLVNAQTEISNCVSSDKVSIVE